MTFRKSGKRQMLYTKCQMHEGCQTGLPQDDCPMCIQAALERAIQGKQDVHKILEPHHLIRILHRLFLETNINSQYVENLRFAEEKKQ